MQATSKAKSKIKVNAPCEIDENGKTCEIDKNQLLKSVLKKAAGYTTTECVDEYSIIDGSLTLVKRKVSTKDVPPDTAAIKLLLETAVEKSEVTLAELESERMELINLFRGEQNGKTI